MSLTVIEQAYAKVNLCLFLGPTRADGRHELVTVFDSLRLTDELIVGESGSGTDEVVCEGVEGPNLVSDALRGLREVGERFAAAPGTAAYGVPSVLAQLRCEVKVLRPISRQVFRPVPNVDSVLLGMRRRAAEPGEEAIPREVSAIIHGAFAHRRKALAGSLALSLPRPADGPGVRERAREALVALGHPADVRAERLSPGDFIALTRALDREAQ